MGYSGPFTLGVRCLFEFLSTAHFIFIGECVIANHVLPNTKGQEIGFDAVARCFAIAVFQSGIIYGYVSAVSNPAMLIALAIQSEISWPEFFLLSLCEFLGAFFGACGVWLFYLPFLKTIPEPPASDPIKHFSRVRDAIGPTAQSFCATKARPNCNQNFGNAFRDAWYYLNAHSVDDLAAPLIPQAPKPTDDFQQELWHSIGVESTNERRKRRRSVNVADLHRIIIKHELEGRGPADEIQPADRVLNVLHEMDESKRVSNNGENNGAGNGANNSGVALDDVDLRLSTGQPATTLPISPYQVANRLIGDVAPKAQEPIATDDAVLTLPHSTSAPAPLSPRSVRNNGPAGDQRKNELFAAYRRATVADQDSKLSIFATKPAIYSPLFNFLQEMVLSGMLVWLALNVIKVVALMPVDLGPLARLILEPLVVSILLYGLIVGLGGPTGFAANPARDLGPRLAHYLLPIPGKGTSMWGYAVIPGIAPLVGGAIAGGLDLAFSPVEEIYQQYLEELKRR